MSERIDQFCENLRIKLTSIDNNMQELKAKIDSKAQTAEREVRTQLETVKKRIEQDRTKLETAQADIKKWVDDFKAAVNEKIVEWKDKREKAKLQSRAENAERYGVAAAVIALAAVDEAEQAALEAWLARKDADTADETKAAEFLTAMPREEVCNLIRKYVDPFRITKGKGFRLKDFDPGDTCGLQMDKAEAADLLQAGTAWLADEQDTLYAQDRWSLLLVFQAMDAAGKDGTIKHVMSGVNPQGCQATSFKVPSSEELDHDFMWRYIRRLPERGQIGIFNRSYYEEVLVVRVHPTPEAAEAAPAARRQGDLGRTAGRHRAF